MSFFLCIRKNFIAKHEKARRVDQKNRSLKKTSVNSRFKRNQKTQKMTFFEKLNRVFRT